MNKYIVNIVLYKIFYKFKDTCILLFLEEHF